VDGISPLLPRRARMGVAAAWGCRGGGSWSLLVRPRGASSVEATVQAWEAGQQEDGE
jgi:hypothetical protein